MVRGEPPDTATACGPGPMLASRTFDRIPGGGGGGGGSSSGGDDGGGGGGDTLPPRALGGVPGGSVAGLRCAAWPKGTGGGRTLVSLPRGERKG